MSQSDDEANSAEDTVKGLANFSSFGLFYALWSQFDLVIEMLIMKELRLTSVETSIVCGGLGFGAKVNILCSLLNRDPINESGVRLLRNAIQLAERNSYAHGFLITDMESGDLCFVRREVRDEYTTKKKHFRMTDHGIGFQTAYRAVIEHFGMTDEAVHCYAQEITAAGLADRDQEVPHP